MLKKFISVAIVIAIAAIFWSSASFQLAFEGFASDVSSYISKHSVFGIAVFIFFSALSAVLSPLTSIPAVPFAVAVWGEAFTMIFLMTGWMAGAFISYSIGSHGIYAVFRRLLPFEKFEDYRRRFSEHHEFILVVLFRLALPAEITGLVLGALRYNLPKYAAATLISELPFAAVAVYAGSALIESDFENFLVWVVAGGALLASVYAFLKKRGKIA